MRNLIFISTVFTLLTGSSFAQNRLRLSVIQDNNEFKITKDSQTIVMKKDKFRLVFNSLAYTDKKMNATQIDAFTSAKGSVMIHKGLKIEDIPFFSPGTGLACDKDKEYECLYIDTALGQQHYIVYDEVNKDRRAKLESRNGDTVRLSWDISKYSIGNVKEFSIKKLTSNRLYLVVLNDFNMNGMVDAGEYAVVEIKFE